MPLWEKRILENEYTLPNDAGTYQLKLPKSGALSKLMLTLQWTGGATESHTVSVFDAFDKIEIVANGSYVVWSLTPLELFMWAHFFGKSTPHVQRVESASGVHQVIFEVPFSLVNKDRSYYLPLGAYRDLELRVTYSPTISATAGFTTGTGLIDVRAVISNDLPDNGSAGFLRLRTVYTYTSAASGDTRQELVGNFPVLGLGVYAKEDQVLAHASITDVEVQVRDGGRSIAKDDFARLRRAQLGAWGINAREMATVFVQDGDEVYYSGDDVDTLVAQPDVGTITIGTTLIPHVMFEEQLPHHSIITMFNDTADGAATAQAAFATDKDVHTLVNYRSIPNGGLIDFALDGMYENAPVPSNLSKMEVILTNGNAGADVRITQLELANVVNI